MSNKKVGISTFHNAHNYGGVLQVYALQETITAMGFDCKVINYQCVPIIKNYQYKRILNKYVFKESSLRKILKKITRAILIRQGYKMKWKKFNEFINTKLKLSKKITDKNEIKELDIDYYILGSDQIWNPMITDGLDDVFFGDFNRKKDSKTIAYAGSIGLKDMPDKYKQEFANKINKIDTISVREAQLIEVMKQYTSKNVMNVVDPTLLLKKEDWTQISKKVNMKNKYILIYALRNNKKLYFEAQKVAKQLNLEIVEIGNKRPFSNRNYMFLNNIGPEEFLGVFENAEIIFTNSFHGTVFSIINNKNFYTFSNNPRSERMISLLRVLGLLDRYIDDTQYIDMLNDIDYNVVTKIVNDERKKSLDFIKNSLD